VSSKKGCQEKSALAGVIESDLDDFARVGRRTGLTSGLLRSSGLIRRRELQSADYGEQRRASCGIRLALGAQRDVLRLVLRQGTMLAVLGTVVGLAAALGLTRYLYGVKPSDPLTISALRSC